MDSPRDGEQGQDNTRGQASPLTKIACLATGAVPESPEEEQWLTFQMALILEQHFAAIRERVHAGEPTSLTFDHPYKRMLWYHMLVPPSYQDEYPFEEWEKDLLHDQFQLERCDDKTCLIWMWNRRLIGAVPVVIDEFFSVVYLYGHYPEYQAGLDSMWRLTQSLVSELRVI